jgi:single-stranded-DNA-specific exonuclease
VGVIVIDHHTVPEKLPDAVALVNPKRPDSEYPERELSSGGLAFRVMKALHDAMSRRFDEARYLDLVALSTVCDMVPLRGENRYLVRQGLLALSKTRRPGLRALLEVAGCDPMSVDADTIGFALGPRLNAAGRLADGRIALGLLMEQDEARAHETALRLGELNRERQGLTRAAVDRARSLVGGSASSPLIFVGHEEFEQGIVGLVAARLAEDFHRPAIVYQRGEEVSRASCRSIDGFDITAALRECGELMVKFGGHTAAAGFTAENARLPELEARLQAITARQFGGLELVPAIAIDAAIPLGRVNGNLVRDLARLEPFGQANPRPLFLSRGVEVTDVRLMGDDGRHLRLGLRDGRVTWGGVAFGLGEHAPAIGDRLDVVYTFSADRGFQRAMELRVEDFALSH